MVLLAAHALAQMAQAHALVQLLPVAGACACFRSDGAGTCMLYTTAATEFTCICWEYGPTLEAATAATEATTAATVYSLFGCI